MVELGREGALGAWLSKSHNGPACSGTDVEAPGGAVEGRYGAPWHSFLLDVTVLTDTDGRCSVYGGV